ncbi:MAG: ATP-dependent zinc metalloprotease FtsH [Clostridia bacterium]|nr:ATP-dependent zinc metalloprotease FtsH [Clostridia bacterium]
MKKKINIGAIIFYLVIIAVLIGSIIAIFNGYAKPETCSYYEMIGYFERNEVYGYKFNLNNNKMTIIVKDEEGNDKSLVCLFTQVEYHDFFAPNNGNGDLQKIENTWEGNSAWNLAPDARIIVPPNNFNWATILSFLPTVLMFAGIIVFVIFILRQSKKDGMGGFGKSKARTVSEGDKKVTFADVAGADEEKEELEECVEYLKNPSKFTHLGAKIPHGVLLVGPPGTGKTLVAKAVAGEAGVPFYSMSGSDFVEMYVGVGASRVRDLFDNARKSPAAIIFIDEIDAVGRQRGAGLGGGHDEREQTLNQLLVEMDGFDGHSGIIVMAATNRPDILDSALLRPGRFDRQVTIGYPDIKGREAILEVHSKNKPFEESVDLHKVAQTTVGFTGADLANLLNESALLAARRGKSLIGMAEIEDSMIKITVGTQKKARRMNEKERRNTAYHEAGHAILSHVLPSQDPVRQISIIPSGRALGYTLTPPTEDKYSESKQEMKERIAMMLGGRVAEQIVFGDYTGGASNDIMRATEVARKMVTVYGMSEELGTIHYGSSHSQSEVFLGRDFSQNPDYSDATAAKIDAEIKKIVDESYNMAKEILTQKREKLDFITEFLMRNEIMDDEQFALAMQDGVTMEEVESLMTEKKRRSEEENKRRTEELRRKKEEEEAERRRLERELGLSDDSQENASLEAPKADNEVTVDEEDFAGEKAPENEEAKKEDTDNQSNEDLK